MLWLYETTDAAYKYILRQEHHHEPFKKKKELQRKRRGPLQAKKKACIPPRPVL